MYATFKIEGNDCRLAGIVSDPVKKSKLFKETFSKFYTEQFKRVFGYMNGWDQFSKEDMGLADGLLGTLFPDLPCGRFQILW